MTTPRPQDTDPLRAKGTDREPYPDRRPKTFDDLRALGLLEPHYPGWSSPPGPLSRLVAWVRKWRRG